MTDMEDYAISVAERLPVESYDLTEPRFERIGVTEYWIIDPVEQIISALELINGRYVFHAYGGGDEVPLTSIPGCTVDFKKVFEPEA